jgi:hypothetical protein
LQLPHIWIGPVAVAVAGCPSWGSKNWTELDFKTLTTVVILRHRKAKEENFNQFSL